MKSFPPLRPATDATPPHLRVTAEPTAAPMAAPEGIDAAIAPLDHFRDGLEGGLSTLAASAEARTAEVPVLGAAVQFATGAGSAIAGMADGVYQAVRHPVDTVKGLWAMAGHVPGTPMWLLRGVNGGFSETWKSDKTFWSAVGQGMIEPYRRDWRAGRYFAVAGRAAVDIGTIVLGARQTKSGLDGARVGSAAARGAVDDVARASRIAEAPALKAAAYGDDALRVSGQVLGEGRLVVGQALDGAADAARGLKASRATKAAKAAEANGATKAAKAGKASRAAHSLERRVVNLGGEPVRANVNREALERARLAFPGDRPALRKAALEKLKLQRADFNKLRQVGPKRLATDPAVAKRFKLLTKKVDSRMVDELTDLLGVKPQGRPKDPLRAAAKLEKLSAQTGKDVRLGKLDDLTRGRINMETFNEGRMRDMLSTLRSHYGDGNLIVKDYIQGKAFYRGRLHVKIRDASGMWYELQVGPKQLSTFYDTPFALGAKEANIHDAIYKGLMSLDDAAIRTLGQGDALAGQQRVTAVLNQYVSELDGVMRTARTGGAYDFARTTRLRQSIAELVGEIPSAQLPVGLR